MKPPLKALGRIAALFALCGAISAFIYEGQGVRNWLLFPLPFAILGAMLFVKSRAVLFVPLCAGVWNAAYQAAYALGSNDGTLLAAFFTGGVIGGLGVTASAGIGWRGFWSARHLLTATIMGGVTGTAFLLPSPLERPIVPFAIWQAAVGTYLWFAREKS